MSSLLPALLTPPIVEVVCGFAFDPVDAIDPMTVGRYWSEKKLETFPGHELHPAVTEQGGLEFVRGIGPVRCWLVSARQDTLQQIQPDRFYFNWRKRDEAYPRCGDHDGQRGVLSTAVAEFEAFRSYFAETFGVSIVARRLELAKIDRFEEGRDFDGAEDLATMMPRLRGFGVRPDNPQATLRMRLADVIDGIETQVALSNAELTATGGVAIRLDTRASCDVIDPDLRGRFEGMNEVLNAMFGELVPKDQLHRFGVAS